MDSKKPTDKSELLSSFGDSSGSDNKDNNNNKSGINQDDNKSYDANFKKFFQRKDALAGILINVVPEFKNYDFESVVGSIVSSEIDDLNAELFSEEDVEERQKIIYDVVVKVLISYQEKEVHLIFDLEMQRKFNLTYPLMNRAIYDVSRIVSKQKISKANYDELLPVQSTWICLKGIPKEFQNRAFHFEYTTYENGKVNSSVKFDGQDLTRIDFLLLSEDYDWDVNDPSVIKFLQSIFHNNIKDKRFNPYVSVSDEVEKEVRGMTEYNAVYELELACEREEARAKGREEGIEEGIAKGIAEGEAKGEAKGEIKILVSLVNTNLISIEDASKKLDLTVDDFIALAERFGYKVKK